MDGRVVVISGALGVLGKAVAARFSDARLVLVDKMAASQQLPSNERLCWLTGVDISDAAAAEMAISTAIERFGRVDVVINTAGNFKWETTVEGTAATWDELHRVNFVTTYNMCRAAASRIAQGGAVVNVGAAAARRAGAGMGPYTASKSAVHRLTEALAAELAPRISVTAVLPTIIDTPRNRADMPDADVSSWVTPAEVANVIAFLASEAGAVLSGVLLPVGR